MKTLDGCRYRTPEANVTHVISIDFVGVSPQLVAAMSGCSLAAFLGGAVASRRLLPERKPECWCPVVGGVIAAVIAAAAWHLKCPPALAWAAPAGALAAVDMHTRRLPHLMTAPAAIAVLVFGSFGTGQEVAAEAMTAAAITGSAAAFLTARFVPQEPASMAWPAAAAVAAALMAIAATGLSEPGTAIPLIAGLTAGGLVTAAGTTTAMAGKGDYAFIGAWTAVACWLGIAASGAWNNGLDLSPDDSSLHSTVTIWAGWAEPASTATQSWFLVALFSLLSAVATIAVIRTAGEKPEDPAAAVEIPAGPVLGAGLAAAAALMAII